ncbi:MAG TPA: hypothetical protein PL002_12190, partial [Flavobacteriales bacterium]|nr:hypothetical protein [Flavobacteriales bacterium]
MNTSQLFTVVGLSLLSVVARGQCTVTTAVDLQQALANTTSGTIQVCGDINLGDLPVDAFPLDLQPNVTLQGDFDLMTNPTGSTIRMPYQFKEDMSCRYGKPISGAKPTGFAFNMGSGSTIRGIHLQGPSNFIKDWRYYRLLGNCSAPETPQVEGLSSGISVRTDGCTVEKCEINGFSYFAVLVDVQDANATFTFAKNFIHHNKMRGYGYGIWVAGRSLSPCTSTADCPGEPIPPSTMANFKTTDVPGLTAFISDCFFWENKHDIAGSGNINSYFVTNCTFSRSTGDVNVDRHTYNWWTCNAVPNPDAPEGSPAREQVITDVGGQNMDFIRCFFYRPGRSVQVPYPNTNACGNNTPGVINFRENFFRGSGVGDIVIAEVVDQNEWSTGHPHIQIGNNVYLNSSPSSPADFAPLIFKPPVAHVASWDVGQPYVPGAPPGLEIGGAQEVQEGGSLGFFTDNCFDSDGSSNSGNLRYMWRFHESSDDMDPGSIIWTDDKPESTPLFHQFNTPGTINVDLIAFDKNTYRVSDIATQRVVVKPNDPNSVHLRFWVSDSYTGRGLLPCPSTPPSAIASKYWNTDQITNPAPTGFVVYAKVDGSEVWSTDIALIDEWRHVDVDITNLIDVSLPLQQHSLEIGLKAVSNVDGAEVRGVEIQLDDVSINGA